MIMSNDMYVGDNCNIAIHCRGHIFTISELFDLAQQHCTQSEWNEHEDKKNAE